uniref:Apoptosis regulator Bcl-2 family BH4 domain-containing protein n=1 Tax=Parascaris equorum TaxID=6256 RepID=A0A914RRT1_PAREQ
MEGTRSTSDVSHIGSESSAEILDLEPLRDFECDKYAVQVGDLRWWYAYGIDGFFKGFVVDYFTYRLQLDGFDWVERPTLPYENLPEYGSMRDVALIFERRHRDELDRMVTELLGDKYLSFQRYVEVRFGTMYAKFAECAEVIKCRQREREQCERTKSRKWSWIGLATVGVVGIGAFTLTRAVLSR